MPTIVKTPSSTWKAVVRKTGFPASIKTFRLKRDAEDWARRTEDEMVRGLFIQRGPSERLTFEKAPQPLLAQYLVPRCWFALGPHQLRSTFFGGKVKPIGFHETRGDSRA